VKLENFIVVRGQFIQDTAHQFLWKSSKYCRSYDTEVNLRSDSRARWWMKLAAANQRRCRPVPARRPASWASSGTFCAPSRHTTLHARRPYPPPDCRPSACATAGSHLNQQTRTILHDILVWVRYNKKINVKVRIALLWIGNKSQSYGASPAIWDYTVLPATWHRWTRPALTPAMRAVTRFTSPGGMEGWVHLGVG